MTYKATAQLIYGYDLGSLASEDGWKVKEVDDDGNWIAPWIPTPEADPIDYLLDTLLHALAPDLARPADDAPANVWRAYSDAKILAETKIGVTLENTGHHDFTGHVLAAHCTSTDWASLPVDFAELESRRLSEDWDGKLAAAVQALQFTPMNLGAFESQDEGPRESLRSPGWLLAPLYW